MDIVSNDASSMFGDATMGADLPPFDVSPSGGLPHDLGDVFGSGVSTPPIVDNAPEALPGGLGRFIEGLGQVFVRATSTPTAPAASSSRAWLLGGLALALGVLVLARR